jgi:hypothetical protein
MTRDDDEEDDDEAARIQNSSGGADQQRSSTQQQQHSSSNSNSNDETDPTRPQACMQGRTWCVAGRRALFQPTALTAGILRIRLPNGTREPAVAAPAHCWFVGGISAIGDPDERSRLPPAVDGVVAIASNNNNNSGAGSFLQ